MSEMLRNIFLNTYPKDYIKNNNNYYSLSLREIKDFLNRKDLILISSLPDENLIKSIIEDLNNDCSIIYFVDDYKKAINLQIKFLNRKNILIEKIKFEKNFLKNNSVNFALGQNFLNSKDKIKEMYRILKPKGRFVLLELFSKVKPHHDFKKYFIKNKSTFNNIIFDLDSKLKRLKNCSYEMKILGNGNFYFSDDDIKNLQDFCDKKGFSVSKKFNILSEIFILMIKGNVN